MQPPSVCIDQNRLHLNASHTAEVNVVCHVHGLYGRKLISLLNCLNVNIDLCREPLLSVPATVAFPFTWHGVVTTGTPLEESNSLTPCLLAEFLPDVDGGVCKA